MCSFTSFSWARGESKYWIPRLPSAPLNRFLPLLQTSLFASEILLLWQHFQLWGTIFLLNSLFKILKCSQMTGFWYFKSNCSILPCSHKDKKSTALGGPLAQRSFSFLPVINYHQLHYPNSNVFICRWSTLRGSPTVNSQISDWLLTSHIPP